MTVRDEPQLGRDAQAVLDGAARTCLEPDRSATMSSGALVRVKNSRVEAIMTDQPITLAPWQPVLEAMRGRAVTV